LNKYIFKNILIEWIKNSIKSRWNEYWTTKEGMMIKFEELSSYSEKLNNLKIKEEKLYKRWLELLEENKYKWVTETIIHTILSYKNKHQTEHWETYRNIMF